MYTDAYLALKVRYNVLFYYFYKYCERTIARYVIDYLIYLKGYWRSHLVAFGSTAMVNKDKVRSACAATSRVNIILVIPLDQVRYIW